MPKKKKYLNGSLYNVFTSDTDNKFNFLFSNIVDVSYDYLLGKEKGKFKAITLSDIATGQANGSMQYPNSAKVITRQVIKNGVPSKQLHLAIKVRPIGLDGTVIPDPFLASSQDERDFAIGMHEWAISDTPINMVPSIPAGTELTCFYDDGRDLGFSGKILYYEGASAGSSFASIVAQPFINNVANAIGNIFANTQNPSFVNDYRALSINVPPRWNGALPTIPTAVITSTFGPRKPPTTSGGQGSSDHGGIDIAGGAPNGGRGTPIYAVNDGKVSAINPNSKSAGKMIFIKHAGGWQTEYMHLDSINVSMNQSVMRGQVIGTMGNTGNSSGTHLHFTVRKDGKKVDPLLVFGWPYKFAKSSTEQRYKERLASAGIQTQSQPKPDDDFFPPESPAE